MMDWLNMLLPLGLGMLFVDGDGTGGTGDGKTGGEAQKDTVAKADYDKAVSEHESTKQDLEDMRMEVLSPAYLEFLNQKEKAPVEIKKTPEELAKETDEFEKLSKKEIMDRATATALKQFNDARAKERDEAVAKQKDETKEEVAVFASTHEDFQQYRPAMYGMSLDPKYKKASLDTLYEAAKEYVAGIHKVPTKEEKEAQAKAGGFKPGGASESYEELRKLSKDEATAAAVAEVKAKLGPLPPA